ncbi:MAG: tetratricopeptide repeat-containing serine protease family protein [Bacteroidota bacterium]
MLHRLSRLVLVVLAAAPLASADPLRLQLFTGLDREVVAEGGLLHVNVEVLAVPAGDVAAEALADAVASWDLERQLGPDFDVLRMSDPMTRWTGDVVEHQRRIVVRVVEPVDEIPALTLAVRVYGRTWEHASRPLPLQTFASRDAVTSVASSVVSIVAEGRLDGVGFERHGSAFAVGGDALVTAYHVVVGARRIRVTLPTGEEVRLDRAWVLDPIRDVAVLALDPEVADQVQPLVVAPVGSAGDVAFTAGWPLGEDRRQRTTVARRHDDLVLDSHRLRTSGNAVRPGDSGGPLLDGRGRVLGVVVSGRGTDGVRDLLAESICLATEIGPTLAAYARAREPVSLRRALAAASDALPAARAHEAAGAIQIPIRRTADQQRVHVALLQEALRESPDDPVLHYVAGSALEDAGEPELAAYAFASSRRAGYVPAGYSLAHHRFSTGEWTEAADLFDEAADQGPYRRLGAFGRAKALIELGRYEEAEAPLLTVLDFDARFAPALYLLGIVRLSQGRTDEARALAVRLATRPRWAAALRLPLESDALRPPQLLALPRSDYASGL